MQSLKALNDHISNFEFRGAETFLSAYPYPLAIGCLYLLVVYTLKRFMKDRQRIPVKSISLIHNFNMFAISIICLCGMTKAVVDTLYKHGIRDGSEILFCDKNRLQAKGPLMFWIYAFYLSKFYELFDTVLILLRKSNLVFLHIYHHWITMILCIVSLRSAIPYQWSATIMNALVHIPMYYYYLCSILNINIWWKRLITIFQIAQFCIDITFCLISLYWQHYVALPAGRSCSSWEIPWANPFSLLVVFSYLLLFLEFYFRTYKRRKNAKKFAAEASEASCKKD
ncbi:elongation of fatty acids protein sre1-like [Schistocerca gregaria]|uniref:elongation of fatty acids protein sre1-like n=1 Tax=Schistocerca gregaria TaxID=7010 RepID=UPI00211F1C2F|nr:elongation of fatty acids protein sre1-like [Schistocerca gregaria]